MARAINHGPTGPGLTAPESVQKDETPAGGPGLLKGKNTADSPDCAAAAPAMHALRVIEGERQAADFLARLHAQQADPDELALIVASLYGATLRGFCAVLAKAVGVRHG